MCEICRESPDCRNHKLWVYLNHSRVDKIPSGVDNSVYAKFHTYWKPVELTARELAIEIYRGYSFSQLHDGRKTKDYWKSSGYVALDFDTEDMRSSLDFLAQEWLADYFASFAYTTPSHTEQKPKARVVWVLENPITDKQKYSDLYLAMLHQFPWADQSTKDVSRFFYGSKGCEVWSNWSLLTDGVVNEIIRRWKREQPKPAIRNTVPIMAGDVPDKYLTAVRDGLLDNISGAANGEKHITLNKISYVFGGYVAGGYFSESDVIEWLNNAVESLIDIKDMSAARHTIKAAVRDGQSAPLHIERPVNIEEKTP